jgi:ubiquinone/menaquinone biosynthesis C-methylase UbiE
MTTSADIPAHYSRGKLMERLRAALVDEGVDPDHPTIESLGPFDHFHGRGVEATEELASLVPVEAEDHVLDIGSGIGGPARYLAHRFGCRITGIDLTPEFCDVARVLTRAVGLDDRIVFKQGDALRMPFADATFDGAYSMNVSMNIADKARLYREIHRVLKRNAWLVLSEIAQGPGGEPDYPTPWAKTSETSFLATPAQTRQTLEVSGFDIVRSRETTEQALAFNAHSRAMVERGEKPPHRAVWLIHGDFSTEMAANTGRGLAEARLVPIEIICQKQDRHRPED